MRSGAFAGHVPGSGLKLRCEPVSRLCGIHLSPAQSAWSPSVFNSEKVSQNSEIVGQNSEIISQHSEILNLP